LNIRTNETKEVAAVTAPLHDTPYVINFDSAWQRHAISDYVKA